LQLLHRKSQCALAGGLVLHRDAGSDRHDRVAADETVVGQLVGVDRDAGVVLAIVVADAVGARAAVEDVGAQAAAQDVVAARAAQRVGAGPPVRCSTLALSRARSWPGSSRACPVSRATG